MCIELIQEEKVKAKAYISKTKMVGNDKAASTAANSRL